MSEICNNCGHAQDRHIGMGGGCLTCAELNLFCPSFTARPDEPKGDERVKKWINATCFYLGLSPSYADLESQLQAERTRREEAEAVIFTGLKEVEVDDDFNATDAYILAKDYRVKYPAQDSATSEDADQSSA